MRGELRRNAPRQREKQDTAVRRDVVDHGCRQPAGLAVATFAPGNGPEMAKTRLVVQARPPFRDVVRASAGAGVFYPELFQRIADRIQHGCDGIDHGLPAEIGARVVHQY